MQALEGLAALHALGILHRDVKPGNLLLSADDEVKVSDFGLALHLDRDETRATAHEAVLGTLEYLSPEQALGQAVGRDDAFLDPQTGRSISTTTATTRFSSVSPTVPTTLVTTSSSNLTGRTRGWCSPVLDTIG